MSSGGAVRSALGQYVGFSGRARRSEYWYFYLFSLLVTAVPYALALTVVATTAASDATAEPSPVAFVLLGLSALVGLALFLPSLAVTVRRLHDTGRTGWWYLVSAVPLVGPVVLVVLLVSDSVPGANQHGPSPKGGGLTHVGGYGGAGYGAPGSPDLRFGTPQG